jgi:hypothetical protein
MAAESEDGRAAVRILCCALVVLGLVCAITLMARPAKAQEEEVTFQTFKGPPKVEPDRITTGFGSVTLRFVQLRPWRNWNGFAAKATGKLRFNTCDPSCADGNLDSTKVKVRLSDIGTCGSERRYKSLSFNSKDPQVIDEKLQYDCDGIVVF